MGSLCWQDLRISLLRISLKRFKRRATREVAEEVVMETTPQEQLQGLVPQERKFKLKLMFARGSLRDGKKALGLGSRSTKMQCVEGMAAEGEGQVACGARR